MRHTKKILLATVFFTASAARALDCSPPETRDLVGFWETRETSRGGIGHALELRPDGTYVEATTVLVNGAYRVAGDRLIIGETLGALEGDKAAAASRFEIQGDTLIQTSPDGSKLEKKRLGKADEGRPAIEGAWRYRHDTGVTAFEKYTPDGRLLFRLPMTSSTGCYKIAGARITFNSPGHKEKTVTFKTRSGDLVLRNSGKPDAVYGLAEAGPWYDREPIDVGRPKD
ncbi:MAG TPA: hypothetical protein VF789_25435 [Thermoanaerobaculia bacterium]